MDSNVMCKEYCNDGVNSNINCGLGVIITHQCIMKNYNKGITHSVVCPGLAVARVGTGFTYHDGNAGDGGGCACVGPGIYGKFLYFLLSFGVNLKLI